MTVGAAVMCWTSPPYWVTFDHGEEMRKERDAAGATTAKRNGAGKVAQRTAGLDSVDPVWGRPGRQLGVGAPLLASRQPHPDGNAQIRACRLR